jgi:hypothetical protein
VASFLVLLGYIPDFIVFLLYRAATVEQELKGITEKQSFNVNGLIELVKENESILVQMRVRLTFI